MSAEDELETYNRMYDDIHNNPNLIADNNMADMFKLLKVNTKKKMTEHKKTKDAAAKAKEAIKSKIISDTEKITKFKKKLNSAFTGRPISGTTVEDIMLDLPFWSLSRRRMNFEKSSERGDITQLKVWDLRKMTGTWESVYDTKMENRDDMLRNVKHFNPSVRLQEYADYASGPTTTLSYRILHAEYENYLHFMPIFEKLTFDDIVGILTPKEIWLHRDVYSAICLYNTIKPGVWSFSPLASKMKDLKAAILACDRNLCDADVENPQHFTIIKDIGPLDISVVDKHIKALHEVWLNATDASRRIGNFKVQGSIYLGESKYKTWDFGVAKNEHQKITYVTPGISQKIMVFFQQQQDLFPRTSELKIEYAAVDDFKSYPITHSFPETLTLRNKKEPNQTYYKKELGEGAVIYSIFKNSHTLTGAFVQDEILPQVVISNGNRTGANMVHFDLSDKDTNERGYVDNYTKLNHKTDLYVYYFPSTKSGETDSNGTEKKIRDIFNAHSNNSNDVLLFMVNWGLYHNIDPEKYIKSNGSGDEDANWTVYTRSVNPKEEWIAIHTIHPDGGIEVRLTQSQKKETFTVTKGINAIKEAISKPSTKTTAIVSVGAGGLAWAAGMTGDEIKAVFSILFGWMLIPVLSVFGIGDNSESINGSKIVDVSGEDSVSVDEHPNSGTDAESSSSEEGENEQRLSDDQDSDNTPGETKSILVNVALKMSDQQLKAGSNKEILKKLNNDKDGHAEALVLTAVKRANDAQDKSISVFEKLLTVDAKAELTKHIKKAIKEWNERMKPTNSILVNKSTTPTSITTNSILVNVALKMSDRQLKAGSNKGILDKVNNDKDGHAEALVLTAVKRANDAQDKSISVFEKLLTVDAKAELTKHIEEATKEWNERMKPK